MLALVILGRGLKVVSRMEVEGRSCLFSFFGLRRKLTLIWLALFSLSTRLCSSYIR